MLAASPTSAPVLPSKLPFKRLSFEEMAVHRDKGLCYHCNDKWVTGHRCKPSLHFLIADEDGEIADTSIPPEEPADPSLPQFPQISLNALAELVAKFLHLQPSPTTPLRVMVGNDNLLECDSVFPAVSISVQGQQFSVDLINLPITGADIVLGVQWLKALGPISTDYSSLTMTFLHLAFSGM
ncbi:hypothetical protein GmHk_10G030083 [Glycine max]|nr:hypothetical protein GmHk_10G030083 [Glycine max]